MCVKHPIFLRKKEGWSREILITIEKEKKIQEKRVVFCSRLYALLILDAGIAHGTTVGLSPVDQAGAAVLLLFIRDVTLTVTGLSTGMLSFISPNFM